MSKIKQSDNEFPATHWTRIKDKDGDKPQWVIHIYFPTSRQMNRTLKRDKVTSKRLCAHTHTNTTAPTHTHYARMCSFFFLRDKNGTHQGRFFTRHVSPVCCCTKIDSNSSPVELCFIKANVFYINAQPEIKCNTQKMEVELGGKCEWE